MPLVVRRVWFRGLLLLLALFATAVSKSKSSRNRLKPDTTPLAQRALQPQGDLFAASCHPDPQDELGDVAFFVRTCQHHLGLLDWLMKSFSTFVPPGTELHVVLDPKSEHAVHVLPSFAKVHVERLPAGEGYTWVQWAYLHADDYTNASFIAFMDSDMVFTTRVTRRRLFEDGKPIILWHNVTHTSARWRESTRQLTGLEMTMDFMTQLPFVVPTAILKSLREHVTQRFNASSMFDAWKLSIMDETLSYKYPKRQLKACQFCIIGTYLFYQHPELAVFRNPNLYDRPTVRVARHLGWEPFLYDGTERRDTKFSSSYADEAARAIHEGYCTTRVFHCDDVPPYCRKYETNQRTLFEWERSVSGPLPHDNDTSLM